MTHVVLDVSKAVTAVSTRISIDAPMSVVWGVILDFPSYPLWNSFVRSQAITDASYKPLLAHPKPKEGDHALMHVRIPPIGLHDDDKDLRSVKVMITLVDDEHRRICWDQSGIPSWLLRTRRLQELLEEHTDGRMTTVYTTTETFSGPAAWLVRWFFHTRLTKSFRAMGEGLKTRSEELATNARSTLRV